MLQGGVIGFGMVGQSLTKHINANRSDARITAVCDVDTAKLDLAKKDYGVKATNDLGSLLSNGLDFVVVSSQNSSHKEHVVAAAQAGKHVFCEKPIALNLTDADEMIESCERAGVVNQVNFSLRFTKAYMKIKELVTRGELGDILCTWRNTVRGYGLYAAGFRHFAICNPNKSGGWAVHCACHGIDIMSWTVGPFASVYSQMQTSVPGGGTEEIVTALFKFRSGAVGMLGDMMCPVADTQAGVVGTKGSAILTDNGRKGPVLRIKLDGKDEQMVDVSEQYYDDQSLTSFFDSITKGSPSPSTIKEARNTLAVALAMQESSRTGKVIEL